MLTIRKLTRHDEAVTESFLAANAGTTMFLRSNLARAGFEGDAGAPFTGDYFGAFDGEALVGVVAHGWNDNLMLASFERTVLMVRAAVEATKRPVRGLFGSWREVATARTALDLDGLEARVVSREILFDLSSSDLVVPSALVERDVIARLPRDDEIDLLMDWRMAYCAETTNTPDTPSERASQRQYLDAYQRRGHHFVVERAGALVAYAAFNAALPTMVQIGGVFTPRPLRGRGHARCAVAGSLQYARDRGVTRAILFTGEENAPARAAYEAIGFRRIGDYGIVMFTAPR
ncbi:MAG: GNAT family N-acetyltransferase [Labilithrix sp.]|nr:GNAT family N-acetyltransferase [Labilithrix sp.]